MKFVILLCSTLAVVGTVAVAADPSIDTTFAAEDVEFFEKRVRPILVERCFECHSAQAKSLRGGLRLDGHDSIITGGDTGPAAVPGKPDSSLLIQALRYDDASLEMPPAGKLPENEIAALVEWVRRGVPFPATISTPNSRTGINVEAGRRHWAFQPWASPPLPTNTDPSSWSRSRLDRFVQSAHIQRELQPSAEANRRTIIRRAKLDLLGLPPDPDEVDDFVNNVSPLAYEQLIDRYLASPHFGERWGRHWLDLTRYCDVPESWRKSEAQAWLYRDWVIRAWNNDLPYDQFVRQQFAADLLPESTPEDHAALGFLGLSPTYWKELKLDHLVIKQVVAEEWEERIDAIGGTFLGLTIACARCHDHKFDPISMQDYYAFAGVLASIQLADRDLLPEAEAAQAAAGRRQIQELQEQLDKLLANKPQTDEHRQQVKELRDAITKVRDGNPFVDCPQAFGIVDASLHVLPDGKNRTKLEYAAGEAQDVALQIRGNAANPGKVVPRRFLAVLSPEPLEPFHQGSGRLELADAIVRDAAPLAARVIVNRIWMHHFGRGLVTTPSNFGVQGERPSHPELLDELARGLVEHDWSLKWLHREIMLSATYRQSSQVEESSGTDPDNVWLARMPLRRLDVEAWRDAILSATGELDSTLGGEPQDLAQGGNRRRTVYATVKRRELSDLLRLYDFPDPVAHSSQRVPTTTPLQQLFVLNSQFLRDRAIALAERLATECPGDEAAQVKLAYRLLFGREATADEVAPILQFVSTAASESATDDSRWQYLQVLLGSNETLYVD